MDNPHYKAALERATNSTTMLEAKQEQIQKHTDELAQLYSFKREWEDNVTVGFAIRPQGHEFSLFFGRTLQPRLFRSLKSCLPSAIWKMLD